MMTMPKKPGTRRKKQNGQSLLELIAMIVPFFTILFMFVQVTLSLGVANYFQYATFMAARALLPSRATMQDQIKAAEGTLADMVQPGGLDRFPAIAKGEGEGEVRGAFAGPYSRVQLAPASNGDAPRLTSWEQGVSYKFNVKMYMLPVLRRVRSNVTLQSETILGREPSEAECMQQLKAKNAIFDNGC